MSALTDVVRRIEVAGLNGWPAQSQLLFGGWIARLGDGYTKRANSVTALGPHDGHLADDVAYCEALYLARGLTPTFRLSEISQPPELDAFLAGRGYDILDPTLVLAQDVEAKRWPDVVESTDAESWLAAYAELTGSDTSRTAAHRALLGRILLPCAYLVARAEDGQAAGCVLAVQDREWVGVYDLIVGEGHRRQGHGRALLSALTTWGAQAGATQCCLQVVEANAGARRFYENLGFCYTYRYWYRVPGAATRSEGARC